MGTVRVTTADGATHDYEGAGWLLDSSCRDGTPVLYITRLIGDGRQHIAAYASWESVEHIES